MHELNITYSLYINLAYYTSHNSHVCCTFLDGSKAFDRVNYRKLINILADRDLPPYIIRILVNAYDITQQAGVSCSGSLSDILPRDARSACAVLLSYVVRPSVRDVDVPWAYRLD